MTPVLRSLVVLNKIKQNFYLNRTFLCNHIEIPRLYEGQWLLIGTNFCLGII